MKTSQLVLVCLLSKVDSVLSSKRRPCCSMANRNRDYVYNYSYADPAYTNDKTTEYPSHQITVEILLNANSIPNDSTMRIMTKELRNKNMELSRSSSGNIITIFGYPPDNGFDEHKVLEIVQKYNRGAQLVAR